MLVKFLLLGLFAFTINANAAETRPQPKADKLPYNFHGEADKTDSYAIPSDSSEEELDDEIEALNKKAKTAHQVPPQK